MKIDVKGKTRSELAELIREHGGEDRKITVDGIDVSLRDKEGDDLDIHYGRIKGFLISVSDKNVGDLYVYEAYDLKDVLQVMQDAKHVAKVFGFDLLEGKPVEISATTEQEFDQRDVTIAKLEAQIEVYKRMLPSTDKVTYQREQVL